MAGRLATIPLIVVLVLAATGPVFADAYESAIKQGRDHANLNQLPQAKAQFENAIRLDSSRYEGYFELGLVQRRLKDPVSAEQSFKQALELAPDNQDCQQALASSYVATAKEAMKAGERPKMLQYLEMACVAYPLNTGNWANLYGFYFEAGETGRIIRTADKMLAANREAVQAGDDRNLQKALLLAAKAFHREKNPRKARAFLGYAQDIKHENAEIADLRKQIDSQSKTNVEALVQEATALAEAKKFREALQKLNEAQSADSSRPDVKALLEQVQRDQSYHDHWLAAQEAEKQEKWDDALQHYEQARGFTEETEPVDARIAEIQQKADAQRQDAEARARDARERELRKQERAKEIHSLRATAQENEAKKQYKVALFNLERLQKMVPDDAEIPGWIARLREQIDREAKEQAQGEETIRRSMARFQRGEYQTAFQEFKALLDDPKGRPPAEILPAMIECCINLDRLDEAKRYLERFRSGRGPGDGSGSGSGSGAGADVAITRTQTPTYWYLSGKIAYLEGDFEAASEPLFKVYRADALFRPDLSTMIWRLRFRRFAWILLGIFALVAYKTVRFGMQFAQKVRIARIDAGIERALQKNDPVAAIPLIEQRLADPEYVSNRRALSMSLAECFLKVGNFERAAETAQQILEKEPKNNAAVRILGEVAVKSGDTSPEGIGRIQALLRLDEGRKDLWAFLAAHFRASNDDSRNAMDVLSRQITLNPNDTETLLYVAGILARRENYTEANLKIFERASKVDPDRPEFAYALGRCLIAAGRREEGQAVIAAGAERWPAEPCFQQQIGRRLVPTTGPGGLPDLGGGEGLGFGAAITGTGGVPSGDGPETAGGQGSAGAAAGAGDPGASFAGQDLAAALGDVMLPDLDQVMTEPPAAEVPDNAISCPHCQAPNHPREYYCTTCGKPLK